MAQEQEPYLRLEGPHGRSVKLTEEQCARYGRAALKALAGSEPWNSDTLQQLGDLAFFMLGFNFDMFLEEES